MDMPRFPGERLISSARPNVPAIIEFATISAQYTPRKAIGAPVAPDRPMSPFPRLAFALGAGGGETGKRREAEAAHILAAIESYVHGASRLDSGGNPA